MTGQQRNRPRRQVTLSPEVDAYLGQKHINASQLVDAAVRKTVADHAIEDAAKDAEVGQYAQNAEDDADED